MNNKIILFLPILIVLISCKQNKYEPTNLSKLSEEEQIVRIKNKQYANARNIVYKNEQGETLTFDSIYKISNSNDWTFDAYVNTDGVIEEKIIRKANKKDKQFLIKLKQAYNYQPPVKIIEIDCDKKPEILDEIYELDQNMRKGGEPIDPKIDRENLTKVISLIENCGMPTLKDVNSKQMKTIWLVFQHSDYESMKKYFPLLEKSANKGDLKKTYIAMMKDRLLMTNGEPQLYGSQVISDYENGWKLYDLKEPELVNKRRREVGFEPLEDYLMNWDIEFDIEQIE